MRNLKLCIAFLVLLTTKTFAQTPIKLSTDQYNFVEGPTWDGKDNIYFTDVNGNAIIKYSTSKKTFKTLVSNTQKANGLMYNSDNTLIVCEGEAGKLNARDTNGVVVQTLASTYNNTRFNSPNDLCIDGKGGVYFSDPTWNTLYQAQNRLYYRNAQGTVTAVITDMQKPNGVILSADGKTLFIDDSWSTTIRSYDVQNDGSLINKKTFAVIKLPNANDNISGADGMALDKAGNLYVVCKLGILVYNNTGVLLKTITLPETATNCIFGGKSMNTLYITAGKNLYSLTTTETGFRHPFDYTPATVTKPVMRFTNITNNQEIPFGTDLNLNVDASHSSGIANVQMLVDGLFLRQENLAPYDWGLGANDSQLNTLTVGQHTLKAIATANTGEISEASVSITIVKIVTGTETETSESFCVYPNPVSDVLHFSKRTYWELFTNDGLKISEGESNELNMQVLTTGVYILKTDFSIQQIIKK